MGLFFREHSPPHIHVKYGDYKAVIAINPPELTEGKLPRRALNLVLDWAKLHQSKLLENWQLCQTMQQPKSIAPLE